MILEIINSLRPVISVALPLTAAGAILVIGDHVHRNIREAVTFAAAILMAATVYSMVPVMIRGGTVSCRIFKIVEGVDFAFRTDAAGMVFACVASALWIVTSVYSTGYMRSHNEKNQTGYYASFALCLSATMGLCFAANLFTFFIFFEVLTVATYPLVVHYRDEEGKRSGRKYLAYTLISGQIFFAGTVTIYAVTGTLDFRAGGFISADDFGMPAALVLFFMLSGAGIVKAGVMPFHSWLPAAMVAPAPVSALLHAVAVVKAGAFCTLRVVLYVFGPELAKSCGGAEILAWMAVFTILASSLVAMRKDNLKERLAFSTVGQLSYIILGICILTPFSTAGAIYHIAAHAFMKITLFMCAGAIFATTQKKNISEMAGTGRRMPVTMGAFTLASIAMAGFPFFAGFISKANIIMGAVAMGRPFFAATLVVSALLALTYLMPVVLIAFRSDAADVELTACGEADKAMLVPLIITAAVSVLLGVAPNFGPHLYDLAIMAGDQIFASTGV